MKKSEHYRRDQPEARAGQRRPTIRPRPRRRGKAIVWIAGPARRQRPSRSRQLVETIYELNSKTDPETCASSTTTSCSALRQSRRHGAGLQLVTCAPDPTKRSLDGVPRSGRSTLATMTTATLRCNQPETPTSTASLPRLYPQIVLQPITRQARQAPGIFMPPFRTRTALL